MALDRANAVQIPDPRPDISSPSSTFEKISFISSASAEHPQHPPTTKLSNLYHKEKEKKKKKIHNLIFLNHLSQISCQADGVSRHRESCCDQNVIPQVSEEVLDYYNDSLLHCPSLSNPCVLPLTQKIHEQQNFQKNKASAQKNNLESDPTRRTCNSLTS